jgi:hypothetical protein
MPERVKTRDASHAVAARASSTRCVWPLASMRRMTVDLIDNRLSFAMVKGRHGFSDAEMGIF